VIDLLDDDVTRQERDQIIVRGWYAASQPKIESITLGSGEVLSSRDAGMTAAAMQSLMASSATAQALWQSNWRGATACDNRGQPFCV
jgi:hypothetical protein